MNMNMIEEAEWEIADRLEMRGINTDFVSLTGTRELMEESGHDVPGLSKGDFSDADVLDCIVWLD